MKKFFNRGQRGFTLIELLIVIAVLGALAAVVVPAVGTFIKTANLSAANTEAANIKTAAMSYLADNGCFPNTSADLIGHPSGDYLTAVPDGIYTFGNLTAPNSNKNATGTEDYPTRGGEVNESMIYSASAGDDITKDFFFWPSNQSWHKDKE